MHKYMTTYCEKCNKFSHCNNNDLICISKYKAKEQECEELKEDRERWKSNFNGKVSAIEGLLHQLDQLKQTLAEIKEICNSVENIENVNSLYDAKLSGMYLQANKILQKISECKGEYNEKIR